MVFLLIILHTLNSFWSRTINNEIKYGYPNGHAHSLANISGFVWVVLVLIGFFTGFGSGILLLIYSLLFMGVAAVIIDSQPRWRMLSEQKEVYLMKRFM